MHRAPLTQGEVLTNTDDLDELVAQIGAALNVVRRAPSPHQRGAPLPRIPIRRSLGTLVLRSRRFAGIA